MTNPHIAEVLAQALLPCPFCGGEALFEQIKEDRSLKSLRWSAGCRDETCIGYMSTVTYPRRKDAAEAWNRRAESKSAAAQDVVTEPTELMKGAVVHAFYGHTEGFSEAIWHCAYMAAKGVIALAAAPAQPTVAAQPQAEVPGWAYKQALREMPGKNWLTKNLPSGSTQTIEELYAMFAKNIAGRAREIAATRAL